MKNIPFVVGQWVRGERFYGREAQIAEILDGPRDWIWLLGTRRLGKTSLLKQLEYVTANSPGRGYFPLFWDLQGAEDVDELHATFNDALLDAEERFEERGLVVGDLEADDLFSSLSRVRRRLRSSGVKLLLLCDEAEELLVLGRIDPSLLRKLRRALQSQADIRSVLASTIRLWALTEVRGDTSPFLHGFTPPLHIDTLTDDEARALVRQAQLAEAARPVFDDDDAERIRERCDNHPYLIQLVCKRALESNNVDEAIDQVSVDRMVSYFFSVDFEMLTTMEQNVLKIVGEQSAATSNSLQDYLTASGDTLRGALQRLEQLAFLRRDGEQRYVLRNYFFRRWLQGWVEQHRVSVAETQGLRTESARPGTPAAEFDSGVIAGRYQLQERVGEGASGVVYRAYDGLLQTEIAIKVLRPEFTHNEAALERFRQEIVLSRDIGHPNILRTYHLGEFRNRTYLTMQWVDGRTLADVIKTEAPLSVSVCVAIAAKLAAALEAAHARRVIHRDIKPQNILIDRNQEPYLMDFGVARMVGEPGITSTGMFLGTPNYASPEQASLRPLDHRSDLYAVGVVLFEMATGQRPFESDDTQEVLDLHKSASAPDPRTLAPALSERLSTVILRCLAKDPEDRYGTAAVLRHAIETVEDR